jgi:hypothetical protein
VAPNANTYPEFAAEAFSWDFDLLEIMNGKNYEYLENLKVPPDANLDPSSGCPVTPGESYRRFDEDGACTATEVAFPGVMEDWLHILSTGKRVVGTANSDSHSNWSGEPGAPRTYFRTDVTDPRHLRPRDLVAGLSGGDVSMSHGPFLTVTAQGQGDGVVGLGGEVVANESGMVRVVARLQAPSWVQVNSVEVITAQWNIASRRLDLDTHLIVPAGGEGEKMDRPLEFNVPFARDGFFVVRARGEKSMFPMLYPKELRPMDLTQITSSLGGALGFGGEGGFEPAQIYHATPWALTNPIWVDADGDGKVDMGRDLPVLPGWLQPTDHPRDIRRLLHAVGCDH